MGLFTATRPFSVVSEASDVFVGMGEAFRCAELYVLITGMLWVVVIGFLVWPVVVVSE
jgi:hypothetical protein